MRCGGFLGAFHPSSHRNGLGMGKVKQVFRPSDHKASSVPERPKIWVTPQGLGKLSQTLPSTLT